MSEQSQPSVSTSGPYLSFRRHGEIAVVAVSAAIEDLPPNLVETAAQVVLSPLKQNPPSNVIVDLSEVKFFTSEFISFLLRCHVIVKRHHGELVLAGVSDRVRELLRQTALDTLWAIYNNRNQALEALMECATTDPQRIHSCPVDPVPPRRERPQTSEDFVREIKEAADKLLADGATRGDVKLLCTAFKELRHCFKVFAAYKGRRKATVFGSARTKPDHPTYQQAVEFGRQDARGRLDARDRGRRRHHGSRPRRRRPRRQHRAQHPVAVRAVGQPGHGRQRQAHDHARTSSRAS